MKFIKLFILTASMSACGPISHNGSLVLDTPSNDHINLQLRQNFQKSQSVIPSDLRLLSCTERSAELGNSQESHTKLSLNFENGYFVNSSTAPWSTFRRSDNSALQLIGQNRVARSDGLAEVLYLRMDKDSNMIFGEKVLRSAVATPNEHAQKILDEHASRFEVAAANDLTGTHPKPRWYALSYMACRFADPEVKKVVSVQYLGELYSYLEFGRELLKTYQLGVSSLDGTNVKLEEVVVQNEAPEIGEYFRLYENEFYWGRSNGLKQALAGVKVSDVSDQFDGPDLSTLPCVECNN